MSGAERRRIDAAMLDSLAASFDLWANGRAFETSFNATDVAEMLRRSSLLVAPGPRVLPQPPKEA